MIKEADLSDLEDKIVVVFNFDFVIADPSYRRLKKFAQNFNDGDIVAFNELVIQGRKEIQVTYKNHIRVRYIHDQHAIFLDTTALYEEIHRLKDFC